MKNHTFEYNNILFEIIYDSTDLSGIGCVKEIAVNDEYKLYKYQNIKNKIIFDIGANIGIASIILAKMNPESTIYSFEPYRKVYDIFLRNIELNNICNIKPFNVAVTGNNGARDCMMVNETMSGANSIYSLENNFDQYFKSVNHKVSSEKISSISLDDATENIDEIYLLKIDCEGAEFDIIYNSECIKKRLIKNMVGEFHNLKYFLNKNMCAKDLIEYSNKYIDGNSDICVLENVQY